MSQSLIRMPEAKRRTGYGKAWIYKLISQGRFPAPVKIGSRAVAFVESEVDEWIAERIAARDKKAAQ
ncbi:AlpA family transcriptional regulator [Salmonella enterica]|uniref:helix-turn-helix transcriptional regulator n=1 Tax=Salmonella enterica TaxID=28901 RepID=UPI000FADDE41|nr:AlpA family transcriptional regulator [Salmonella enterica]EBW6853424.1 AlpA family transcriptional regulator [Salmonella enterica subsp. enterica serovar Braenderup]EAW9076739.1 AlpA family transcriptional regulator [Salmonella enterica]ECC4354820.1 AlpA family transcriptional regulator [Salmonella enterica]ECW2124468.1 AlpA family transcriptional regulator [Salmonella enterica]